MGHAPLPGDLHQPLEDRLEGLGADELGEPDQGPRVRHALAIDATEGAVDEAAPDLALTFVEAPVAEMLEQEPARDDGGGRLETPPTIASPWRAVGWGALSVES